ncbi:unnamed protein product [Medioppia subpectinata]|uniref:Uncharacterized protein n=1 Tax=Medioppia subpectinata TaxID=1979941 RepID=A0A7R9LHK6_9ACAR|nr:unnamed protein product [Medioppia subpectinata]CAG2118930.1 unnamed protein product [Medioppia subpectinata]
MNAESESDEENQPLNCPYTCFRPTFGTIALALLLVSLQAVIYLTYVSINTPNCYSCQSSDKNCETFCNIIVDDFITQDNVFDRNQMITYLTIVMSVRFVALISGFIGVFLINMYLMTTYLILYFGLLLAFFMNLIFIAAAAKTDGNPTYGFVFGKTTLSVVLWSVMYSLEVILFLMGLALGYKYAVMKFRRKQ